MPTDDDSPEASAKPRQWVHRVLAGIAVIAVVAVMAWDLGAFEAGAENVRRAQASVPTTSGAGTNLSTGAAANHTNPAPTGSVPGVGSQGQEEPPIQGGAGEDDRSDSGAGAPPTTAASPPPTAPGGGDPAPTLPLPPSDGSCVSTAGALQSIIDSAPDGKAIADMKGKLADATALGFTVIDLSGYCFENQGAIKLTGRYGLWMVRPTTYGSNWVLNDVSDTVLSGLSFNGGSLTATGGNQRIEAGEVHNFTIVGQTDFMMGKMTISGHTTFDTMTRVESDKSFARNSTFASVEVTGAIHGFNIENSTAKSLVNTANPAENLVLDLTIVR